MHPFYHERIPNAPGIYRITCIITGKIYVGSAVNLRRRCRAHLSTLQRNGHHNPKLQAAFNKYGPGAFTFEVLELVLLPSLTRREKYWLKILKPFGKKGFNIIPTAGSNLGLKHTPETREKLRQAQLDRKASPKARANMGASHKGTKRNAITRAKMSQSLLGNTRNLGKKLSFERREHLRLVNLGSKRSAEAKRTMSKAQTGRKHTDEAKKKISLANRGKEQSAETRARNSVSNKAASLGRRKTLVVTSPDGIEYSVVGIREFCKEHNLDRSTLIRVAKGQINHHKGWKAHFP